MQGMSAIASPQARAKCPFLSGKLANNESAPNQEQEKGAQVNTSDSVSLSPFEPADSGPLSKTCVSTAAKATMGMMPGFAKAGCPHAA